MACQFRPEQNDLTKVWDFASGTLRAAAPVGATDAATKGYVDDAVLNDTDYKVSVVCATIQSIDNDGTSPVYNDVGGSEGTGQITWTTGPTAIDGVTLANGDRILVKDESGGLGADANGIYVRTDADTWDRATDFDTDAKATPGAIMPVEEGTTHADTLWMLTTNGPITLGTASGTSLAFGRRSAATPSSATPTTVNGGDAGTAGVGDTFARGDHEHPVSTAAPGSIDGGDASVEGVATSLSRSDHQHDFPARVEEQITAEVITGSDTAITDTIDNTPRTGMAISLYLNGQFMPQGAGKAYTLSGDTITWLASSGCAPDLVAADEIYVVYWH
ncbi:MAG TPA: hypothetical protein VM238_14980 [Phycisphaerae bacterium]|nr:hypothetical protein [Phycisphaerae bacterium]